MATEISKEKLRLFYGLKQEDLAAVTIEWKNFGYREALTLGALESSGTIRHFDV